MTPTDRINPLADRELHCGMHQPVFVAPKAGLRRTRKWLWFGLLTGRVIVRRPSHNMRAHPGVLATELKPTRVLPAHTSKYWPHQGPRECARRLRQQETIS